jgi:hypothetical protein
VSHGGHPGLRRARPAARRLALAGATLLATTCWLARPQATPAAAAADVDLQVVAQVFNLAVGATFDITLGLPDGITSTDLGPDSVVTLISHAPIDDRAGFEGALEGRLGDEVDQYQVSLDPAAADPAVRPSTTDSISLTVPTDAPDVRNGSTNDIPSAAPASGSTSADTSPSSTTPTSTTEPVVVPTADVALSFDGAGVHAVEVEVTLEHGVNRSVTTFVHVIDPDLPDDDMPVALVMGQTTAPTVDDDGTVAVTDADEAQLAALADTLETLDSVAAAESGGDGVPRGVFVEPSTLQALHDDDPALAERLVAGLSASDVFSAPVLPLEPSAAAASGQADLYAQFLSRGEDLITDLVPRAQVQRIVHVVRQPFTPQAAALQRTAGARLMVLGFDDYLQADGGNGMFTDTSQLVAIALPNDSSVPAALIDPHIAQRLEDGVGQPVLTSIQVVADLLVIAQSIDQDGGDPSRHGMVLARSDAGVPDAVVMGELSALLLNTDGLRMVEPDRLASSVDQLQAPDGDDVTVELPDQTVDDLDGRMQLIVDISTDVVSFTSMLPDDDPAIQHWLDVLQILPSTAVTDDGAEAMVQGLRDDFDVYLHGIQGPAPFTFTLTGRSSTLSFNFRNTTDTPLTVRMNLSSPKLTFPDGDQTLTLPAQQETEVNVRTTALSNGQSSVFLRLYPQAADSDIQLMPEVVLTARVSSLAGLGQLLTGAGLLLLVTWWGRHWQQARRKRMSAGHVVRHPSSNGKAANGTSGGSGDDLPPDAAASSLSPS